MASLPSLSRRRLLKASLLGLAATGLPASLWALDDDGRRQWYFSAVDDSDGGHYLAGLRRDGAGHFLLPSPERCHGGCLRPGRDEVVLFARRPGQRFHVLDARRQASTLEISAGQGRHFYGHGVFDPSGRWLYVTANRIDDAMGLVQVHDAEQGYRHVGDHLLDGIGPHELGLMPDGETLVVALGGIRTQPDSGRAKLNLSDMDPALLLLDRHSGEILERHRPSHHQLSCRHLDIAPDGTVVAGYQFQGPEWETDHPLIARRAPDGSFSEQVLPSPLQGRLAQYTASVATSQVRPSAAISAPRGNKVLVLGRTSGELLAQFDIEDAAGVRCDGAGGYLVTTGGGEVHRIDDGGRHHQLAALPLRWDNHLT